MGGWRFKFQKQKIQRESGREQLEAEMGTNGHRALWIQNPKVEREKWGGVGGLGGGDRDCWMWREGDCGDLEWFLG